MSQLIIKTNTSQGTDVEIKDVGVPVPASGGSITLDRDDVLRKARDSADLRTLTNDNAHGVGEHTLILNDGSDDIPVTDIESFLDAVAHDTGDRGVIKADGSVPFSAPVAGVDPTLSGHLATKQYVDDQGAGSGITESEHEDLDRLTHRVNESGEEEYVYSNGKLIQYILWQPGQRTVGEPTGKKVRETLITYSGSNVSSVVEIQYLSDGTTEQERNTWDNPVFSGGRITQADLTHA
jgi:hypothetical protein